ncbi:AAA family ATPase [bacterium]|nr:AAA family ATPase [bacterium]
MLKPEWERSLRDCPQNPEHHGEGDVLTHTQMVVSALKADPDFQALSEPERETLEWAAWLHDVAKPLCLQPDLSCPGHARKGSQMARPFLYQRGLDRQRREQVCNLVRYHMVPYRLIDATDWQPQILAIGLNTRCDLLTILARADARGRICRDQQKLLDQIELFAQLARENPPSFADDHSLVTYFRKGGDPHRVVFHQPRCRVTVMSGLPAAGKDHWIAHHGQGQPVVSLDGLREQLDVSPDDDQGEVIQTARELARQHLRAGRDFIWNATNLSQSIRNRTLDLCFDYEAEVRLVYVEAPFAELERRNLARSRPVPAGVVERMLRRWEPPDRQEAHELVIQSL